MMYAMKWGKNKTTKNIKKKKKTGRKPEGILDCTEAIKAHSAWTKAYALRAQTYMETEMYEEAVRDYTHLAEDNQGMFRIYVYIYI